MRLDVSARYVPSILLIVSGCVVLTMCDKTDGIAKTAARPPATRVAPVTETIHGTTVVDNYRWLEGDTSHPTVEVKATPEVAAWTSVQNEYTRSVLDHVPGRQALEAQFGPLSRMGSVAPPIVAGNRFFFASATAADERPSIYWRDGYFGADKILLASSARDAQGPVAVVWFSPSADGKVLAYGSYHADDSGPTLHLVDVDTATPLPLEIPNVPQSIQWLPDRSGFFYQTADADGRRGLFHRMGTPPGTDVQLFRQATPKNAQGLPPAWGPSGSLSADGHWMVLSFGRDAVSNDLWLANFDQFQKTGRLSSQVVSVGARGHASGTVVGSTLFLFTTKGAPRGRIVSVSTADPGESHWREIIGERPDAVIEDVSFGRDRVAITYKKNASTVIQVFDPNGQTLGTLKQPGIGLASLVSTEDRTEGFLTFTSFNYPATVFRVDLATPEAAPTVWMAPEVAVDPTDVHVDQVWYPSKDGTRISMFLAYKGVLKPRGDMPTMLLGYGGFGVSMMPTFSATFFQWFEAGGLLAVPNLRGGGEYGEPWHAAGMLDQKQHAFDDFIAAAEWLTANKYTNPQKLAIYGGSHGALAAAAVLTERPDLIRAAVLRLPVLDMLRYQFFLTGSHWVPEYGSSDDPLQASWLFAYSPYHRVQKGTKYPGVLLTASEDDREIPALHARKMAAALQAATASDPADHPILLRVDASSDQDPSVQLRDIVDQRLFIMWQLGMP